MSPLWGACTYDVRVGRGEGGTSKPDESTDNLRECDSDKGEGVKKYENVADVKCQIYSLFTSQLLSVYND